MFDIIKFIKDWETLLSGILSGAIAGILTYLGVMLTLKKQAKSEYPKKLVTIDEMIDTVHKFRWRLIDFELFLIKIKDSKENYELESIVNNFYLDSNFNSDELLSKAAFVDKETYQIVLRYGKFTPNETKLFGNGVVWKGKFDIDHVINSCRGYQDELLVLMDELGVRAQYYLDRI
ncbi:hypothetical protein [Bacillus bingmayongensis]|uniref:hypothetical protein n=1 Tax=Bacillus bingmayongensis TaxID=1150157 RepID=UPI001C8DB4A6|nr:hypothetical protein [Bacillus bingmayongensis]MBY0598058.1 hypothetical protein [Bacillus bingmayongensis]